MIPARLVGLPVMTKRTVCVRLLILAMLVAGAVGGIFPTSATLRPSPEVSPLIAVAPQGFLTTDAGQAACTTPPPVENFSFLHCYTPAQMQAAYGIDRLHAEGLTGKGQTIVIVDSYGSPTALEDLQYFSRTFGLPEPDLTVIYPTGKPTYSKAMHGVETNWAFETSLDLQWAHAMAPDAKLVLVASNPAETEGVQGFPAMFLGEKYAVEHYPGAVISQSFGVTEQSFHSAADEQVARFDEVYRQAVARHVTVISSSGDWGTANVDKQSRVYQYPTALWPASDPLVTAAGGTWLQAGWRWTPTVSAAQYHDCLQAGTSFDACVTPFLSSTAAAGRVESVWKEDWISAATGGMRSTLYPTPSFQAQISHSLLQERRGVPDVSWNAAVDGGALVYMSFMGSSTWLVIGGTSAAAPQLAAVVALTNQLAGKLGRSPVGYLNPQLYNLPARDFDDIVPQTFGTGGGMTTLASNEQYGSGIPGMATTPGYDLTTGLGSPNAYWFVHDLAVAER